MILDLQQGSPEWHELRKTKITASMMPIIMGDSPYDTPFGLWQQIVGLKAATEVTPSMQRGLDLEPIALAQLNSLINTEMKPGVIICRFCDWAMASMDGVQSNSSGLALYGCEIKCANAEDHELAKQGKVPKKYKAQVQWQLFVTGLKMIYYYSFDGENGAIVEVHRNQKYIEELVVKALEFKQCVDQFMPPEMTEKEKRRMNTKQMTDEQWSDLLQGYLEATAKAEWWETEIKNIKEKLIELAGGLDARGAGFKLSKVMTRGRIDYDAILKQYGIDVDLEQYRKPNTESWRITKDG